MKGCVVGYVLSFCNKGREENINDNNKLQPLRVVILPVSCVKEGLLVDKISLFTLYLMSLLLQKGVVLFEEFRCCFEVEIPNSQ